MALTLAQQIEVWHDYLAATYPQGPSQPTLTLSATDLQNAVAAVDTWVTNNAASYNAALPAPFVTTATSAQKAALLAFVVMRRYTG